MVRFLSVFLVLLLALPVYAHFYGIQKGEGYYQYHKNKPNANKKYPRPILPDNETLMSMPTQDFSQLVTAVLNHALTERNLDTYADYARIQQVAFKRADEFANLQVLYAHLNPPEDENDYNRRLHDRAQEFAISQTLRESRSEYGLIYFYSVTCTFCAQQTPLLRMFQERHGWEVEAVDIDQRPDVAQVFQVNVVPMIRMVDRNRNVYPISNGLITLPEIEERAYRFIRYIRGDTTETTFTQILR